MIKKDSYRLLQALTRWCELSPALSDRYQTFTLTGKAGAGDSSRLISSGRIQTSENHYTDMELDAGHLARANRAYVEYRRQMLNHARGALTL